MISLIWFCLAGVGITNLIVNGAIFDAPRNFIVRNSPFLGKMITCMMCSGYWVGFVMGFIAGINFIYAAACISLFSFVFSYLIEITELTIAIKDAELKRIYEE